MSQVAEILLMAKDAGSGCSDLISPAHCVLLLVLPGHVRGQVPARKTLGHVNGNAHALESTYHTFAVTVDAVCVVGRKGLDDVLI